MYIVRGYPVVVFIAPFKDIFLDAIRVWTPYVSYGGNGGCGEALHATCLLHAPPEITLHATCYMQAGGQLEYPDVTAAPQDGANDGPSYDHDHRHDVRRIRDDPGELSV